MYKTVRHGENSLQYTILPQTEEVINNSGLKGKGRDYSPSIHVRRSRRRSTLKYVLIVVFGVTLALALASVPLYIMNGALYSRRSQPDHHDVITSVPMTPTGRELAKSRKKELKISADILSTLNTKLDTSITFSTAQASTVVSTVGTEKASTTSIRAGLMPISTTPSTTIPPIPTEDDEKIPLAGTQLGGIRLLDHYMSPWEKNILIRQTLTPETITLRSIFKHYTQSRDVDKTVISRKQLYDNILVTTTTATTSRIPITTDFATTSEAQSKLKDLKDTLLSVDDDDEFKESLEVDEVFSLPPLKPDSAAPGTESDEVTVSKAGDGSWYGARWPFVDTSSYFQWTGYSPGDNLLLPLLVAALSSVALVLLLALAVRRRKRTHIAATNMAKLAADMQADDNTNLLSAENPEDAEE